ncbi:MAG TPA: CAP domain-containing protein, partial [Phototrophicaceae bacterium]|nr:CAP domain-containing protein [Phototrophicaceae bacterium]
KNKSASKTYQNPDHGIKVQYPNDWTFSEENGSIVKFGQQKYLQLDDGSFVAFYSPLENNNDTHLANLRVYAKELPAEIEKLDGSSHLSLLDLYSVYFSHFLKYSNLTVVEPIAKTRLGSDNKSAYQIQYASGDGKQKQQSMLDTFTIYNNKIYGLRYTSEPNEYSKHLPAVKTMAESFETMPKEKQNEKRTDGTESSRERSQISNRSTINSLYGTVTDDDNSNNNSNDGNSLAFDNSSPETHLDLLKNHTLAKINEDRQKFGLRPVNLSHNSAAQYQAENILTTKYMSHLTTNGEKPYMLYSKMGGLGKVRQNVAFIGDPNFYAKCVSGEIDCKKINPLKTINLLEDIMVYNDAHAKWHHRHNILDTYPTHVSLGIAYDDYSFALVQNFENNYINFSTPIVSGNSDRHVNISGTLLDSTTRFHSIEIYYDDLPAKSFYERYKDPNLYQPGKLVAAVKAATNVGFASGNSNINSNSVLKSNSPPTPLPNITMVEPTQESYYSSQNNNNNAKGKDNDNQAAISLVFDVTPLLKGNKAGVYTVVIILEDQNHNLFPGGAHSIFHNS